MIMKCQGCGITYDNAYGHFNCPGSEVIGPTLPVEAKEVLKAKLNPILPAEVIESWDLTYNVGVAVEKIGRWAFAGDREWQHLEDAIQALRRELNRLTGGQR